MEIIGIAIAVVLQLAIGIWLVGAFFSSFYFWAKRTDRSMAPVERRLRAGGHGLAWPYYAFRHFKGKAARAEEDARIEAQRQRIVNGRGAAPSATNPAGTGSGIRNPFEDA